MTLRAMHALAVLALLAPATAKAPAQSLRQRLERCGADDVAQLTYELRAARDEGLQTCLGLLVRREFESTPAGRQAARDALCSSLPAVREELRALTLGDADEARLRSGLELLGATLELADLDLALALAARFPTDPEEPPESAHAGLVPLRAAAAELFARHAEHLPRAAALLGELPEPYVSALISALGESRTPQALGRLGEWLARGNGREPELVNAIALGARGMRGPFDLRTREAVRARLDEEGARGFREAVLCTGWLEDEGATYQLARLLRSPHPGVRADAVWSLQRITGARHGTDPLRWARWLAAERDWRAQHMPRLLEQLSGPSAVARAAALNELARHRFPRHELAEGIAAGLIYLEGPLFVSACEVLRQLGSAAALDGLGRLALGARSEPEVRAARETKRALQRPLAR